MGTIFTTILSAITIAEWSLRTRQIIRSCSGTTLLETGRLEFSLLTVAPDLIFPRKVSQTAHSATIISAATGTAKWSTDRSAEPCPRQAKSLKLLPATGGAL